MLEKLFRQKRADRAMVTASSAQEPYSIAEHSHLAAEKRMMRQKMARATVLCLFIAVSGFGSIAATGAGKLLFFFLLVTYLSLLFSLCGREMSPMIRHRLSSGSWIASGNRL